MFYWENGLRLAKADLAVDFSRRQPRAFISHAHIDHMARHEYALCTPETGRLYQARFGRRPVRELPYRQAVEWGGLRLTTFPAGHCLGSAMLLVEDGSQRLLYTGDFKLGQSYTAQAAELPEADLLIIESTFGDPRYCLPPRAEAIEQLLAAVGRAVAAGRTPVVEAYTLGKSQEVTAILTRAGLPVVQHRQIAALSRVYEECGVDLGPYGVLGDRVEPGQVLVVPPGTPRMDRLGPETRLAVTGWAARSGAKYQLRVDEAIPLSDHADYNELFEAVARVRPRRIYCTHGPESFAQRLCDAGYDARVLGRHSQAWLF